MYYPIIDKLKEIMAEIGQSGGGALVIEATPTSETGGTWTGNFEDIETAFDNNTPVYCFVSVENHNLLCTLVSGLNPNVSAFCTTIPIDENNNMNIVLYSNNTFETY